MGRDLAVEVPDCDVLTDNFIPEGTMIAGSPSIWPSRRREVVNACNHSYGHAEDIWTLTLFSFHLFVTPKRGVPRYLTYTTVRWGRDSSLGHSDLETRSLSTGTMTLTMGQ
ncbi:hypothetical protein AVEN_101646-1 [Araneus ventricosus]|uniref:Uncharacterized protein n=1 Tax=Araneus ventricosus TaxID=182803 RepID=A0A4Y2EWS5_ARAVE|nr:hypothetical protein AVEN_101646-1 [Araneus ventricosus]